MTIQYNRGDVNPMVYPVVSTQKISKGDLVVMQVAAGNSSLGLCRAEDVVWDTDTATTQSDMIGSSTLGNYAFAGVAAQDLNNPGGPFNQTQSQPYGNSKPQLRVNTAGVFNMDCTSASYTIGQRVGAAKASGNALLSQTVAGVGHDSLAIGRVAEDTGGVAVTNILVQLMPASLPLANPTKPA